MINLYFKIPHIYFQWIPLDCSAESHLIIGALQLLFWRFIFLVDLFFLVAFIQQLCRFDHHLDVSSFKLFFPFSQLEPLIISHSLFSYSFLSYDTNSTFLRLLNVYFFFFFHILNFAWKWQFFIYWQTIFVRILQDIFLKFEVVLNFLFLSLTLTKDYGVHNWKYLQFA